MIRTGIDLVFLGSRLASLLLWYRSQFRALASFWELLGFIYIYASSSYIIYIYHNDLIFIEGLIIQICIFPQGILIWMIR